MNINKLKKVAKEFILEEEGIGVVEIILILVIVIGLVIIFKDRMTALVNSIFSTITSKTNTILR
ncbi:MAG: hypothetical protein GX995_09000 [Clostridiales bacterium]|nr:hypothetical protein [Clostridiales bacterium]